MGASPLRVERPRAGALRLTLASPPANALSEAMIEALQELDEAGQDDSIRVVVIAADGKLFSGGHDLKQMTAHRGDADGGRAYFEDIFARCSKMMQTIRALQKPVVAEVAGLATAAGCQLVASCDIVVASSTARFGVNGIDIGLFCSTPMVALSRSIGPKTALDMLMTGEMIDADRALAAGLVSRIAQPELLREEAEALLERLLARPANVLALGKRAFYKRLRMPLAEAYDFASATIVENMLMDEAKEGIGAFIEKRKPGWPSA
jgi:enoyl-CoA hydratase/carnithine racemase